MSKKIAVPNKNICVGCGTCVNICPNGAISIYKGLYATVDPDKCEGCGKCAGMCSTWSIEVKEN